METDKTQGLSGADKISALVVDDDRRILRFIEVSLRLAGYQVNIGMDGEEALDVFRSKKIDIVVLDMMMPVMDGLEVLRQVRADSDLPVIAMSGNTALAEKAIGLGANDFLVKPFMPDELLGRMKSLTERKY